MKQAHSLRQPMLAAALAVLALTAQAANLDATGVRDGKARISADYKTEREACQSMAGNAKDVCVEEAKAKEKVARAALELDRTGKSSDDVKLRVARAESTYAVAREKCDDLSGNGKDVCVKEAKSVQVKALAAARMVQAVGEARSDSAKEVGEADFKLATEKCDGMAGDAKADCMAQARSRFGK